jgi:hypothetical protein
MAKKPNYSFEKRQKELQKKAKKEEKRLRKQSGDDVGDVDTNGDDGTIPAHDAPDTELPRT